jgi:hypothetical protein
VFFRRRSALSPLPPTLLRQVNTATHTNCNKDASHTQTYTSTVYIKSISSSRCKMCCRLFFISLKSVSLTSLCVSSVFMSTCVSLYMCVSCCVCGMGLDFLCTYLSNYTHQLIHTHTHSHSEWRRNEEDFLPPATARYTA